jgi:hypothetical protein
MVRISPDAAGNAAPRALHPLRTDVAYWHETDVSTGSEMSAYRGTPEVIGARQNDAIDPKRTWLMPLPGMQATCHTYVLRGGGSPWRIDVKSR